MKKTFYIVLISLLHYSYLQGQDVPRVIPPSPTAASLGQYGDVPVSNYTGVPNISIPLYTIKSGAIELPISLSYHGAGIKVAQEASWVGLGWALNAGGVITRAVRGRDDLKQNGYLEVSELPSLSSNIPDFSDPDFDFYDQKPLYDQINLGGRDGEPDLFYFNFLGQSGKMVFERNGGDIIKGIPLKQSAITFHYKKSDSTWTVVDEKGWKYYFGTTEITQNYSTSGSETFSYTRLDTLSGINYLNHTISAWYIDRIETPFGDFIDFTYDEEVRSTIGQINYSETQHQSYSSLTTPVSPGNVWSGSTGQAYYYNVSASMQRMSDLYLNRIDFINGHIEFITSDKEDMRQEYYTAGSTGKSQKLDEIKVFKSDGAPFKKTSFNYSYFNNHVSGYNRENYWRLKLNSVQESYYDQFSETYLNKPPYIFAYNGVNLPAKNSAAIDHWGYYNGQLNNDKVPLYLNKIAESWNSLNAGTTLIVSNEATESYRKYFVPHAVFKNSSELLPSGNHFYKDGAFRECNETTMKASMLESITYPTGGSSAFTFEPNDYNATDDDADIDPFEDKLKEIIIYSGDQAEPVSKSFTLTHTTRLWLECTMSSYDGPLNTYDIEALVEKSTGEDIVSIQPINESGYEFFTRVEILLPAGDYKLVADSDNDWDNNRLIEFKAKYVVREFNDTKVGGGLRVAKIESLNAFGEVVKTKKYNYEDDLYLGTTGRAMTPVAHFYFNGQYEQNAIMHSSGNPSIGTLDILIRSSNNEIPLGSSAQGNFVGYNLVKVMDVDSLENSLGKSVYHYTNGPEALTPYHLPGIYGRANHGNGELIKEEHFNANGNIVKRREFRYEQNGTETIITKGTVTPFALTEPPGGGMSYSYFMRFYDVVSDWRYLSEIIEISYDINGTNSMSVKANFEYTNSDHKQLTKTTTVTSKGESIATTMEYPSDYPSGTENTSVVFDKMIEDNILSAVVKQETIVDGTRITNGSINNFIIDEHNHVVMSNSQIVETGNNTYETMNEFHKYDTRGNILEMSSREGVNISFVWGYNQTYPVAKIINAAYASVRTALGGDTGISALQTQDGTTLLSTLNALRTDPMLTEAQVITYTHDPLVGMTSQTDPSGITTYYEYDHFGRLKATKDDDGNILQSYNYHYKGDTLE